MRLSASERGVFWELIFFCYKEGSLPDDVPLLARICDLPIDVFEAAWPNVSKSFFLKAGRWHNRKVDEELPEIERRYEQKRKAGEASAQRRRSERSTSVEQPFNERSNGRSTGGGTITRELEQEQALAQARAVSQASPCDDLFTEVFNAYPEHRRDDSYLTQTAWAAIMGPLHPDDRPGLHVKILDGLERAKASDDWIREGGRFVPKLQRFLEERQWTRSWPGPPKSAFQILAEKSAALIRQQEAEEAAGL